MDRGARGGIGLSLSVNMQRWDRRESSGSPNPDLLKPGILGIEFEEKPNMANSRPVLREPGGEIPPGHSPPLMDFQ
jgi:hypothetical protein